MTVACVCRTMPPSVRCAALRSVGTTGPSPDPTKAASGPPPSTPSSKPPSSTPSTRAPGSPTFLPGCPTTPPSGSMTCCPGMCGRQAFPPRPDFHDPRLSPGAYYLEEKWHSANIGASYYDFLSLLRAEASTFESVKQF